MFDRRFIETMSGGDVVRAIGNDVIARQDVGKSVIIHALRVGNEGDGGIDGMSLLNCGGGFGRADVILAVEDLSLQIAGLNGVIIGDADCSHARSGQIDDEGCADASCSHHQHFGTPDFFLSLAANLR